MEGQLDLRDRRSQPCVSLGLRPRRALRINLDKHIASVHCWLGAHSADAWDRTLKALATAGYIFVSGFSCKSVSSMNLFRSLYSQCTAGGTNGAQGQTGQTFAGCLQHVISALPAVIWWENVKGLKGRNLENVLTFLRTIGYLAVALTVHLSEHGFPVLRARVWIFAVLAPADADRLQKVTEEKARQVEVFLRQKPVASVTGMLMAQNDGDFDKCIKQVKRKKGETADYDQLLKEDIAKKRRYIKTHRKAPMFEGMKDKFGLPVLPKEYLQYLNV